METIGKSHFWTWVSIGLAIVKAMQNGFSICFYPWPFLGSMIIAIAKESAVEFQVIKPKRHGFQSLPGAMTDTDELRVDRQDGCAYTLEAFIDPWNLRVPSGNLLHSY